MSETTRQTHRVEIEGVGCRSLAAVQGRDLSHEEPPERRAEHDAHHLEADEEAEEAEAGDARALRERRDGEREQADRQHDRARVERERRRDPPQLGLQVLVGRQAEADQVEQQPRRERDAAEQHEQHAQLAEHVVAPRQRA